MRNLIVCVLAVISLSIPAYSAVIIGDWENGSSDGWIDWVEYGSGESVTAPASAYRYNISTVGATSGINSLQMTQSGWSQNLALKLHQNDLVDDFLANTMFQIDVTYPATSISGWQEVWEVSLNAEGYGWHSLSATNPVAGSHINYGPNGGAQTTLTLSFDYSAALSKIGSDPEYVELIFSTNSDAAHGVYYFDNARLISNVQIVPEPATIALLSLGCLSLLKKRKS